MPKNLFLMTKPEKTLGRQGLPRISRVEAGNQQEEKVFWERLSTGTYDEMFVVDALNRKILIYRLDPETGSFVLEFPKPVSRWQRSDEDILDYLLWFMWSPDVSDQFLREEILSEMPSFSQESQWPPYVIFRDLISSSRSARPHLTAWLQALEAEYKAANEAGVGLFPSLNLFQEAEEE